MKEFEYRLITNLINVRNIKRLIGELTFDNKYINESDIVSLSSAVNILDRRIEMTIATHLDIEPELVPEMLTQELTANDLESSVPKKPEFGGGDGSSPNE